MVCALLIVLGREASIAPMKREGPGWFVWLCFLPRVPDSLVLYDKAHVPSGCTIGRSKLSSLQKTLSMMTQESIQDLMKIQ